MKILLINPLYDYPSLSFPLGIAYIGSSLRAEGYHVQILDANCEKEETVQRIIKDSKYDIVGISGLIHTYKYQKKIIEFVRDHNRKVKIIVGGKGVSSFPEFYLQNTQADIVVLGEGEVTIKEVVKALKNNSNLSSINGIYYKSRNNIFKTKQRELIKNLDEISFPSWDLFAMEKYLNVYKNQFKARRSMPVLSARGCIYRCTFCFRDSNEEYRTRSINNVIREISLLYREYCVRAIAFVDELFLVNRKRVFEFCEALKKSGIPIKWHASGRANLVNEEILMTMKLAGCVSISYGIESGNQTILNNINKQISVEQARRAILITKKVGMHYDASFMIGNVGETTETIKDTVKFIEKTDIDVFDGTGIPFCIATPLPRTELFNEALVAGKIKDINTYIERISERGNFANTLVINMSDLSNEKLMDAKKYYEKYLKVAYIKRHKFKAILFILPKYIFGLFKRGISDPKKVFRKVKSLARARKVRLYFI